VKLLLDTYALIWSVDDPTKLADKAAESINDPANDLLLSAASIWELSIKVSLGKLRLSLPFRDWMDRAIADLGATILPITVEFADTASALPGHHGDPFDRMLVAQSKLEKCPIASGDAIFDKYGIDRLW
jgi:PIN domain nuclease of toxin-antitoxin system